MELDKIIKLFFEVQKIPYKMGIPFYQRKINKNLKHGGCRHKSYLLKILLEKKGIQIKDMKAVFDFKDLPVPEEILALLKHSGTRRKHYLIEANIGGKWIKIDPAWNPELELRGFPITKVWDGKRDTEQISSGLIEYYDPSRYEILLPYCKKEIIEFKKKFNEWLYSH